MAPLLTDLSGVLAIVEVLKGSKETIPLKHLLCFTDSSLDELYP